MLGRLLVWRGKADQSHMTQLAKAMGLPARDTRRNRIGRPRTPLGGYRGGGWGSTWFEAAAGWGLAPLADA